MYRSEIQDPVKRRPFLPAAAVAVPGHPFSNPAVTVPQARWF
jgi:hypothetical protein